MLPEEPKADHFGIGKFATDKSTNLLQTLAKSRLSRLENVNRLRCSQYPLYSDNMIEKFSFRKLCFKKSKEQTPREPQGPFQSVFQTGEGSQHCLLAQHNKSNFIAKSYFQTTETLQAVLDTPETLEAELHIMLQQFLCIVPSIVCPPPKIMISSLSSQQQIKQEVFSTTISQKLGANSFDVLQVPRVNSHFQLPELRLIQYDCGKLQVLDQLLWKLKSGRHRVLIFTQMSRMLDIFEQFLNYHGHTYLRLDGSTKIEQRQALMERFNADQRIFCFILSTRSGGVGVNLTGADTVIFYDSDWNPTMDAQAQDRCHRIGQTRDVHIYRLVSDKTIEENILKKAQQKKLLGDLAIEGGNFTTAFFNQSAIKELFEVNSSAAAMQSSVQEIHETETTVDQQAVTSFEQALCKAEKEVETEDATAAEKAIAEVSAEFAEFDENIPIEELADEKSAEEIEMDKMIGEVSMVWYVHCFVYLHILTSCRPSNDMHCRSWRIVKTSKNFAKQR